MFRAQSPLPRGAWLLCLAALLAACTSPEQRKEMRGEVRECADDPASAACDRARQGFQLVRYPTMPADRLVAATSRALGDLNFETERDDAQRKVGGSYVAGAPVHAKQLDELFRKTLRSYAPGQDLAALSARAEVQPLPGSEVGGNVRLQLFLAGAGGAAQPVDSIGPYQIFFRQLGIELGAAPEPLPDEDQQRQRPRTVPSISGV